MNKKQQHKSERNGTFYHQSRAGGMITARLSRGKCRDPGNGRRGRRPSRLYYTYYHLKLLMMVCIILIWFLLTVLQESSNLDAILIVCRKIKT